MISLAATQHPSDAQIEVTDGRASSHSRAAPPCSSTPPGSPAGRSRADSARSTDSLLGEVPQVPTAPSAATPGIVLAKPLDPAGSEKVPVSAGVQGARRAFQTALEKHDATGLERALSRLSPVERFTLCNTPTSLGLQEHGPKASSYAGPVVEDEAASDDGVDLEPRLPLCLAAAHGAAAMVKVLSKPGRALTMAGDQYQGVAYTPMRWAADYGRLAVMRTLYFDYGTPLEEALGVCVESAGREVCKFLAEAKVDVARLLPAQRAAVERDDGDSLDNLLAICGAAPDAASAADNTTYSLLAWATLNDRRATTKVLLERKADADYLPEYYQKETHAERMRRRPLYLALQRQPADPILVDRLLDAGAKGEFDHLRLALDNVGDKSKLYIALLRSKVEPTTIVQAATLRDAARAAPGPLLGLVASQEGLLRRRQAWTGNVQDVLFADKGQKYLRASIDELAKQLGEPQAAQAPAVSREVAFFTEGGGEWRPAWFRRLRALGSIRATAALRPAAPAAPERDRLQLTAE